MPSQSTSTETLTRKLPRNASSRLSVYRARRAEQAEVACEPVDHGVSLRRRCSAAGRGGRGPAPAA